ncbi:GPI-anchor transamidase [Egretta garzetta]|uniref:GPI-anchor transamidase n=1 Tax=Egretta garzetta TaxID=188379 RepID=UPI00163CA7B4|nr:GPI-anchor transamidase [Egretta garzetta]
MHDTKERVFVITAKSKELSLTESSVKELRPSVFVTCYLTRSTWELKALPRSHQSVRPPWAHSSACPPPSPRGTLNEPQRFERIFGRRPRETDVATPPGASQAKGELRGHSIFYLQLGLSKGWMRIKQSSSLEVDIQITGQFCHIVLMLADDMACNPRNPKPATVFSHKNMELNVYGDDVEVDYRSYEVTVENFLRVLTGRIPPSTPRSKRLLSDDRSNILIYMTGHGGNGFLKFQDSEEITNVELADAFEQMWQKRRYNELLFIIDTCQGASMYERFYSPNIMALASSQVGEDSLSHQPDLGIGVHLMDRYTFYVLEFLEEIHPASQTNMNDLFQVCPKSLCVSTPGHRTDLFQRDPHKVLITDFFGSVRKVEITTETISLDGDLAVFESKLPKDELATEPLKYAEQLPVAQIIHQKPKQKDWHPPGGFILGLWALIIMVFFKTYGIKHMKHIF